MSQKREKTTSFEPTGLKGEEFSIDESKLHTFLAEKWPIKQWYLLAEGILFPVLFPLMTIHVFYQGEILWTVVFGINSLVGTLTVFKVVWVHWRKRKELKKLIFLLKCLAGENNLNLSKTAEETSSFDEEKIHELLMELDDRGVIVRGEPTDKTDKKNT